MSQERNNKKTLVSTQRQYNGGKWTKGRWNSFVTSALRSAARRYPPKYEALNAAKTEKKTNKATGRLAQHYQCFSCNGEFSAKNVQVDHIKPVVDPDIGFISWDVFIENLFCEGENLQVLCLTCHKEKSAQEKAVRTEKNKK